MKCDTLTSEITVLIEVLNGGTKLSENSFDSDLADLNVFLIPKYQLDYPDFKF